MTHWEDDMYTNGLPPQERSARWRKYVGDYQGVVPPSMRGEQVRDQGTKTHFNGAHSDYFSFQFSTGLY